MGSILDIFSWMSFNTFLAAIPVLFGYLLTRAHRKITKFLLAVVWIIFLPNTIYLLTDIIHLFEDWDRPEALWVKLIIASMYTILMILGIVTFILSLHPLEVFFRKKLTNKTITIIGLNLLIGFGIVLGRVERTNSWEFFTNTAKVIHDTWNVLVSPEKILLAVIFGILCNIVYFSCHRLILQEMHEIEKL